MTNKNLENLRIAISLGRELILKYSEIADYYREGKSKKEIVEIIQRNGGFEGEYPERVLKNSIRWALTGNDRDEIGEDYAGLMSKREYKEITRFGKGGAMPWEVPEFRDALKLEREGFSPEYIAMILNQAYHFGKGVRNTSNVEKKLNLS
jgi:hypothetical protein